MSNVNVQNNPSSQNVAQQYRANDTSGGPAKFDPGLSGVTMVALLRVMEAMMKIAILYGQQQAKEVNAQQTVAEGINECDQKQGDALKSQYLAQGISGIIGGGLTIVAAGAMYATKPSTTQIDADIKGAQSYQELIKDPAKLDGRLSDNNEVELSRKDLGKEENQQLVNKRVEDLKNQKSFSTKDGKSFKAVKASEQRTDEFTDQEMIAHLKKNDPEKYNELKQTIDDKVESMQKERQAISDRHSSKTNTVTNVSQSLGSVSSSAGTTAAAQYTKTQKDEEGQASVAQAALNTAQSVAGQFVSSEEKYIGEVSSLVQIMGAISNANALAN